MWSATNKRVLRSADAGRHWTEVTPPNAPGDWAAFFAVDDLAAWAVHSDYGAKTFSDLSKLVDRPGLSQLLAIYSSQGQNLEHREPLLLGDRQIGSIRIGVSTLLLREDLQAALRPAIIIALGALAVAVVVATLLSQLLLRPIHVIRSGLTRLGRGEFGVRLDLNQHDEFGELGTFFNAVSEQLSADRSQMAGQVANLESAVEHLEDAVAIVNAGGELLFANPAMRTLLPARQSRNASAALAT